MMKRVTRLIGGMFILSGLTLILIVLAGKYDTDRMQERLISSLKEENNPTTLTAQGFNQANNPLKLPKTEAQHQPEKGADGVLRIPSIELEAAAVNGVSSKELNYALGRTGHGVPGNVNAHAVIAGHNSGTKSEFFNRLDEVKKGDTFSYETRERVLQYKVTKIEVVRPEQIDRVNPVSGQSLMTLVTCYPERSSTYRLLVSGVLIEKPI